MLDGRGVTEMEPRACGWCCSRWPALPAWSAGTAVPAGISSAQSLALVVLIVADMMAYSWYGLALPLVPALIVWLLGETAGRCLRRMLRWEERHGHRWPLEESVATERIVRAT